MKIDPGNPVVKTGFSGIYVHYPYCIQKCEYCDFYSLGNGKNRSRTKTRSSKDIRKK